MSVVPERPHATEQPVLLRLVEPGPPPEPPALPDPHLPPWGHRHTGVAGAVEARGLAEPPAGYTTAAGGWRSAALSGLPDLRPEATAPERPARPALRTPARAARLAITDAEARGLAGAMARAVLEALEGRRPVHQLGTLLGERAVATVHTLRRGGLRWPVRRATVTGVRVFQPSRTAVEACVTFTCEGGRTRVLALRIDRERRRWVGTAVRVG